MDNIKKFAGDAGTFLTRAVQVIVYRILSILHCSYGSYYYVAIKTIIQLTGYSENAIYKKY